MNLNNKTGNFVLGLIAIGICFSPCLRAEVQVTDNVVVVVDASGSMGTPMAGIDRMSVARDALKQVLGQVPESTHVGVLVFPRGDWVYPLGKREEQRLNGSIDSIKSGGGTPLGAYMKRGADALLKARKKQFGYGTYRLLVVTDGEANDTNLVEGYTPDIISRGITVDVIGVDMAAEHTLATVVDSYQRANNPKQLVEAVTKILAETSTDDQTTSDSDFELLQPLTDELAIGLIKALTSTPSNQPIESEEEVKTSTSRQTTQIAKATQPTPDNSSKNALILIGILVLSGVIFFQFRSKQKPN